MKLSDLLVDVDVSDTRGDLATEIRDVVHDSRGVEPGAAFCCVTGATRDGHDFAADAVARGAAALVVERFVPEAVPQVRVADVRGAMGPLAAGVHGHPSRRLSVYGVTGTNGKTTTTYLLESIARSAGLAPAVIGTVETRVRSRHVDSGLTTPEAPDLQRLLAGMVGQSVSFVAMEVSSHALDQHRVGGTEFAVSTFLNLSHDHLDYHGTLDRYFEAKARLFEVGRTANAVVNVADPRGRELAARTRDAGIETLTFAASGDRHGADLVVDGVDLTAEGSTFSVSGDRWRGGEPLRCPLAGPFNVVNALAALASAVAGRLDEEAVSRGLASPDPVPGRFERVDRGQGFSVVVDYAHTPDALAHALGAARELTEGRVVVVFGCGGDRDRAKRPEMGRVAADLADVAWVTSDNPRTEDPEAIVAGIVAGIPDGRRAESVRVDLDRRSAISAALDEAGPGDFVVVAGKGHETGQVVGNDVRPFDDRLVVAEALERLGCGA